MNDAMTADSSPRRIVVIKFAPLDRDPRVLRQIETLQGLGTITTVGYGPKPHGADDHIEIPAGQSSWRSGKLALVLLYGLRLHRRLYFGAPRVRHVLGRIAVGSMDVVVANDALAVPLALELRPRRGVHADLHEYSPRQGEAKSWKLLVAPLMRWACRRTAAVSSATTVAPGIAEEYRRSYGIDCAVVPNAARYRGDLAPTPAATPLRLVHIGVAGRARRLEVMIDAVIAAERVTPGRFVFDLYLAAGDQSYIDELCDRVVQSGCQAVQVRPPVPYAQMVDTLAEYDVGMFVCPGTTFNLEHALPNKFFEYVQARLGVIIGPSVEMAQYVRRYGIGVIADGFDAVATHAALDTLDRDRVTQFKAASHACAEELSSERTAVPWREDVAALLGTEGK